MATDVISAARPLFRYEWIWDKGAATGFANARRMPMRRHENVLVFYKRLPAYHPQGLRPCRVRSRADDRSEVYGTIRRAGHVQRFTGFPQSILSFRRTHGSAACQKPVELLEYLIRTYTTEGGTVLDNVMGTGSTGVAAARTGRAFVGFEIDPERFRIAERRINEALTGQATMPTEDKARRYCGHHQAEQRRLGGDRAGRAPRRMARDHARKTAVVAKQELK